MRHRPLCFVFPALMLVIALLHASGIRLWGFASVPDADRLILEKRSSIITGVVCERWKNGNGYDYLLKDTSAQCAKRTFFLHRTRISSCETKLKIGSSVTIGGRLSFFDSAHNPGGFDQKTYYEGQGITARVRADRVEVTGEPGGPSLSEWAVSLREELDGIFRTQMGESAGAVLSAMLLGERAGLEEEVRIDYSASGLSHLLAISGLHVGILGAALLKILIRLRVPVRLAYPVSALGLFLYCGFSGNHDSTLRAFLMFAVMAGAKCFYRSYDMLSSLSLAGILLLVCSPGRLFRTGFQLSFSAVAGLGVIFPVLKEALDRGTEPEHGHGKRWKTFVREGFLVWVSVNAATVPIVLAVYYEFPVYGAAANILLVPLTGVILILGAAGGLICLLFPPAGYVFFLLPRVLITLQDLAGKFLRALPCTMLITGRPSWWKILAYYLGLAAVLLAVRRAAEQKEQRGRKADPCRHRSGGRQKRRRGIPVAAGAAAGIVLMGLVFWRPAHGFAVTALDVGQGDSIVITSGNGHCFLIDGGSSSAQDIAKYTIQPYLKCEGLTRIDGIFVTHNDSDHMNGVLELLGAIAGRTTCLRADRLFLPGWMRSDGAGEELARAADAAGAETVWCAAGDVIRSGQLTLEVLSPAADAPYTGNEGSLVLGLRYEGFSALFAGDLEGEAEEELAKELGPYDYLKVAHHGSSGTTSEAFLAAVRPKFCVISAPRISQYGHPGKETIARIEAVGAVWAQTGLAGAVTVSAEDGEWIASCFFRPG